MADDPRESTTRARRGSTTQASGKAPKKAKAKKTAKRGDVKIVIGAKSRPANEPGIDTWSLEGEQTTDAGDRCSVAYLTSQDLHALGWVRRKY